MSKEAVRKSEQVKITVNFQGQTVAKAKDILESARVRKFIEDFAPVVRDSINQNRTAALSKKQD